MTQEAITEQLMIARYKNDKQAEALQEIREVQSRLQKVHNQLSVHYKELATNMETLRNNLHCLWRQNMDAEKATDASKSGGVGTGTTNRARDTRVLVASKAASAAATCGASRTEA